MKPPRPNPATLPWPALGLGAIILAVILYGPALHGSFVFDDLGLPFQLSLGEAPLNIWLTGTRPVLMFTYWINYQLSGGEPFGYHLLNVIIHAFNSTLVCFILFRLLEMSNWSRERSRVAGILGAVAFLIHPLATESVSYIAGRSESLAAMFVLAAYTIFLYRRANGISWRDAALVVLLFGFGVATKENAVALIGVLLLTDWIFPPRRNWRLYVLFAPGIIFAAGVVAPVLFRGGNAGFSVREFTWYQYGFTQARAIFTYLRLAILPLGQSVDHDFVISRTILQNGAWLCLLLVAVLVAAATHFRRRVPLACFGLLMFLIWLAPTSSVIPIADPLVERRMYLPMLGLILMACDAASRLKVNAPIAWSAIAIVFLCLGAFCYDRNRLWGKPEQLLAAAALQSVHNPRPTANLTETLIAERRCGEAIPWLQRAERLLPRNYVIEASWGRALECVGRRDEALWRLQRAAELQPSFKLFELIGLLYGEMNRLDEAGAALRKAVALEPRAGSAHRALALWHEAMRDLPAAEEEYRTALALDPADFRARAGLANIKAQAPREPERPRPMADAP